MPRRLHPWRQRLWYGSHHWVGGRSLAGRGGRMCLRRAGLPQLTAVAGLGAAAVALATTASPVEAGPAATAAPVASAPLVAQLPPEATARAAMGFVHTIRAQYGQDVWASTDWDRNRIILAAAPGALSRLSVQNGTDVDGLKVDVIPAAVTPREFDDAILAVSKQTFPRNKTDLSPTSDESPASRSTSTSIEKAFPWDAATSPPPGEAADKSVTMSVPHSWLPAAPDSRSSLGSAAAS
jgi:hypothetical protein